jgi:hypothetical protein
MNPPSRPNQTPSKIVPPVIQNAKAVIKFESVNDSVYGYRIVLYGPGGIGKSTLSCLAPGQVAFVDADESLEKLKPQLKANGIPIPVKVPVKDWQSLRSGLQSGGYEKIKTIVLDTWGQIEPWMMRFVLSSNLIGGKKATSIEDYGYGKGYRHMFDEFGRLLGDLDAHIRAGRNVIIVMHDETKKVPNPAGLDFLRWEPKAQDSGSASIKLKLKEWADQVLFVHYEVSIESAPGDKQNLKAGRANGVGFRTMETQEMPHFMAKSRTTSQPISIDHGVSPWEEILK